MNKLDRFLTLLLRRLRAFRDRAKRDPKFLAWFLVRQLLLSWLRSQVGWIFEVIASCLEGLA